MTSIGSTILTQWVTCNSLIPILSNATLTNNSPNTSVITKGFADILTSTEVE